jgi:heme/copper-type cytochrome/quinol oxidase subunit 2
MRFKMHVGSWQTAVGISQNFSIRIAASLYTMSMIPAIFSVAPLVLQESTEQSQRVLYSRWSVMMLVLILLCIIAITCAAFIVTQRRAQRRKADQPAPKESIQTDAWSEAGHRIDDSITEITDED